MEREVSQEAETLDRICGELELWQARSGYRFGVESLLLAGFVTGPARLLVDLGTGSGILSLVLVHFGKAERALAVELQPQLAERARRSVAHNRLEQRIEVWEFDLRRLPERLPAGYCDLVVSNPPHLPAGSGRHSPNPEKALAKHELACSVEQLAAVASHLLEAAGRFVTIYPAERLAEVLRACTEHRLRPARLRFIHPRLEQPPRHFLLECRQGSRCQLQVEPPLLIYDADGSYQEEVQGYLYPSGQKDAAKK